MEPVLFSQRTSKQCEGRPLLQEDEDEDILATNGVEMLRQLKSMREAARARINPGKPITTGRVTDERITVPNKFKEPLIILDFSTILRHLDQVEEYTQNRSVAVYDGINVELEQISNFGNRGNSSSAYIKKLRYIIGKISETANANAVEKCKGSTDDAPGEPNTIDETMVGVVLGYTRSVGPTRRVILVSEDAALVAHANLQSVESMDFSELLASKL
ncbi:hypothetical protein TWF481_002697 [Arthrobotrys musiformis]|uniref:PIN domain-containing protein n=1 Tax=Arthrobotrys musiformis TaxID=47236 RepID=A0AAV9VSZ4_9PEZI